MLDNTFENMLENDSKICRKKVRKYVRIKSSKICTKISSKYHRKLFVDIKPYLKWKCGLKTNNLQWNHL